MNQVIEKTGEFFLDKVSGFISNFRDEQKWKKLFVDTGEFFVSGFDRSGTLIDDMAAIMSSDNMLKLAKNVSKDNGYKLKESLYGSLMALMKKYELPKDVAESYTRHFMMVVIDYIEKELPDQYKQFYLADWKNENSKSFAVIQSKLDEVRAAVKNVEQYECKVYSPIQLEAELLRSTENPKIGLDFFKCDDDQFQEAFQQRLCDDCIYVKCQCKEEGVYIVLNELLSKNEKRIIYVVKSEKDWNNLRSAGVKDSIMIPWFSSDEIVAIEENTNIFIMGVAEKCHASNRLDLRRRTKATVRKALEQAGAKCDVAYQMVEDTHGLYIPLKKKLLKGIYNVAPLWAHSDNEQMVLAALLCGQWTNSEGDQLVLSELADCDYKTFEDTIQKYTLGEDPLLIKNVEGSRCSYALASVENAWDYLDDLVQFDSTLWGKFVEDIYEIMTEKASLLSVPYEDRVYKVLGGDNSFWSKYLKQGMLRSVVMKAFYLNKTSNQYGIDSLVRNIMSTINDMGAWVYIADYMNYLFEASPEVMMERLESEFENPTGLTDMFFESSKEGTLGDHAYTRVLWGVEQLLSQKRYAVRAIKWLLRLDDYSIDYKISNSPRNILEDVFCPWIQLVSISKNEKKDLARESFAIDKYAWEIIYQNMPGQKSSVVGSFSHPKYRDYDEHELVKRRDIYDLYCEYTALCISNSNCNVERWSKLISILDRLNDNHQDNLLSQLKNALTMLDDKEKVVIDKKIRSEIYRHRFFTDSEWAMDEAHVLKLEEILPLICYDDSAYSYSYLFGNGHEFEVLHPVPYKKEKHGEENRILAEKEVENVLSNLRKDNYDIKMLISVIDGDQNSFGRYLALFYSKGEYEERIFVALLHSNNERFAVDYLRSTYNEDINLLKVCIELARNEEVAKETLAYLYLIQSVDVVDDALILSEKDNDVLTYYWNSPYFFSEENEAVARWRISNCQEYTSLGNFLSLLERHNEFFSDLEILELIEKACSMREMRENHMDVYYLEVLLRRIQRAFRDTNEVNRIAMVELHFASCLEWEHMKCFRECLADSPEAYLELIKIIYKSDNEEADEEKTALAGKLYGLFYKISFCPGEKNGVINHEKLIEWVESFVNGLKSQGQEKLAGHLLGKILANSPKGEDGYSPNESVRKVIEKYYSSDLKSSYCCEIFNSRGVYSCSAGKDEMDIARKFKENADAIRARSPKTAMIYDELADEYYAEAAEERRRAENDE